MYIRFPRKLHIELTNRCNARCPMCARTDANGLHENIDTYNDLSYDLLIDTFGDKKFEQINYCGNYGDPLMHPDFLRILKSFEGTRQLIHTNGSLQTKKFWKELASINGVVVVFGIDGTDQHTHEYYRRNTNYKKILDNAKIFNENGGESWWQFIVFEHNQHQINDAKDIAHKLGFSKFETLQTRRFYSSPVFEYQYDDKNYELNQYETINYHPSDKVICKAQKLEEIYIDAEGFVYPCTYTASKRDSKLNINTRKIDDIIYDVYFDDILFNPLDVCHLNCKEMCNNKRVRIEL